MMPAESPNPDYRHAVGDHQTGIGKGLPEFFFSPGVYDPVHSRYGDVATTFAPHDPLSHLKDHIWNLHNVK
jgi:hypothetical protein